MCVNAHCNPRSKIRTTAPCGVRDENKVSVLDFILPGHPCAEADALNVDKKKTVLGIDFGHCKMSNKTEHRTEAGCTERVLFDGMCSYRGLRMRICLQTYRMMQAVYIMY